MPITSIQMGTTGQSTAITISTTIPSSKRPKTTLLLNSTRMSNCLLISLVLLLLAQLPIHSLAVAQLPICKRHQACAAEVAQFPLLSETAGNMVEINVGQEEDGSGQGSGQEVPQEESFPFYDEFVSRSSPFDYQADADLSQTQICRCPSEENDGQESTTYYLQQNNITKLFEDNQQDLELATEQLSEFLERDLDAENLVTLKQKVQDKYRYVEQRRHLLLKHCAEGYENNQWVFVKESGQSTNTPNSHQGRK